MVIYHYEKVDVENIVANFTHDRKHRASLFVPCIERNEGEQLCVIGQNPSDADEHHADKTIRYLEQLVFDNMPKYSSMIMLNLYSRIDTKKEEITDLERPETRKIFTKYLNSCTDILLVCGGTKKDGAYNFDKKLKSIKSLFSGKNLFKIDAGLNTIYPPHPGNPKILYNNFNVKFSPYGL